MPVEVDGSEATQWGGGGGPHRCSVEIQGGAGGAHREDGAVRRTPHRRGAADLCRGDTTERTEQTIRIDPQPEAGLGRCNAGHSELLIRRPQQDPGAS